MLRPINNHLLIEPVKHESFLASSDKDVYDEIGIVLESYSPQVKVGDKVYFDSWMAAKFPTGEGDKYYWLVKLEDIRAIESNDEDEISK